MKNNTENIDYWVGRVLIILFFLFVLSFLNSNNNCSSDSNSISTEQTVKIDYYAIPGKNISFPNYNNSVNFATFDLIAGKFKIQKDILNNTVNQQLKRQKLQFYRIKPKLLQLHFIHKEIFSEDKYLLIS
jgi:hypothetical protein